MSKSVTQLWALLGVALIALMVSACGDSDVCVSNDECGAGQACFDGECILQVVDCYDDLDCGESYQQCLAGQCVNNTSCDVTADCAPGQACDSAGACVERQCSRSSDCPGSYLCDEGICTTTPRQCRNVGEECVPGEPTRSGFACEDLGDGPTCYETCTEYRVCGANGSATSAFDCGGGQACVTATELQNRPVCRPSQCAGIATAEEDCAEIVAANPELFAAGVNCGMQNGVRTCLPAGGGDENDACTDASDCSEGLVCVTGIDALVDPNSNTSASFVDGFCARPCSEDGQCGGEQACIGETSGAVMGSGFCGDRCDPFAHTGNQCGEALACAPVDGVDGLCGRESDNELELYESCSGSDSCPDSSACIQIEQGVRKCLPLCDPTLRTTAQRDATCPSADTSAYIQVAHFGADLPAVDIAVDGEPTIEGLAFGSIAGEDTFLSLPSGERQITVTSAGASPTVLYDETLTLESGAALLIGAVADSTATNGLAVLVSELTRGEEVAAAEARVRLVHGINLPSAVDVVFAEAGADVSEAANRIYALENALFGDVGSYMNLAEGDYDVYVFDPGAFDSEDALATLSFTATGGAISTEFIIDENAPTLIGAAYDSAPMGRVLGGTCINLSQGAAQIGLGFCLESCANSDQWGVGACSGENDRCNDFGDGTGICLGSGGTAIGETCEDDSDCVDGAHCDMNGTGEGVCRSYCQPEEQTNDALACGSGEICVASAGTDNFGKCRIACNPGPDSTDPNCPADQKGCFGPEGQSFCQPSGDLTEGASCGNPETQNCQPGLVCARQANTLGGFLQSPFTAPESLGAPGGTCTQVCEPFKAESGCPDGFACSPITPDGASVTLGHCVERTAAPIRSLESCDLADTGKMCDENSFCIEEALNACAEPQAICVQLCDFFGGGGCTDGTVCEAWSDDGPLFGLYGICR
ncbi:DUF4397 domain-containing protein [Lujinxingia vulgaris]|uniref:DUF4397 domain-containing protein n=1 Tax=Lujinxingia vulgaris TaxID=2600176 RepID=A0A5C6XCL5_9DELT|nr:DUF4397 domain-containing protein [Lujinxingia vulgaris]TXD39141.1 DUF4397 domain-containing protein [Lujinxingia vulgaris]